MAGNGEQPTVDTAIAEEQIEDEEMDEEHDPDSPSQLKYSRTFLMQFKTLFTNTPTGLPNIEIIKGFEGAADTGKGGGGGRRNDRNDKRGGKGGNRNNRDRGGKGGKGRNRRDRSREPQVPLLTGPVKALEVSENRWKKVSLEGIENLKGSVLVILNKITPEKFDVLFQQLLALDINTVEALEAVIDCIFDKALMEPAFCPLYAMLCASFSQELPEVQAEDGSTGQFRRLLLNKCQHEFEQESTLSEVEDDIERGKIKRRMLGNIKFIGELYLKRMLMDKIMFFCIANLVTPDPPDEEDIEALCNLIQTIGAALENSSAKAKPQLDSCFAQLKRIKEAKPPLLQSRYRFMIQDLFDLRNSRWNSRQQVDAPTTLAQVHQKKQENPHDAARRKDQGGRNGGRPPQVQTQMRQQPRGRGSNKSTPQGAEDDGWAVAGQKQTGGSRTTSPKDEWTTQGGGAGRNNNRGGSKQDSRNNGKGGGGGKGNARGGSNNNNARSNNNNQKPAAKPKPAASQNAFALMGGDSSSEEESEDEQMETPNTEAPETPVEASTPKLMNSEIFEKKLCAILDEYLASSDEKEAQECVQELEANDEILNSLVSLAVIHVMEKKDADRVKTNTLLAHFSTAGVIKAAHAVAGCNTLMESIEDLGMDVPMFGKYVANTMGVLVAAKGLPATAIKELIQPVMGTSSGTKLFVWLFDQIATSSTLDEAKQLYPQVGVTAFETMHEEDRTDEEAKVLLERARAKNELGWLFASDSAAE